jgi:hypothetical protein
MSDQATSVMGGGSLTAAAPAAGTLLATLNVPDTGYYELIVWGEVAGAVDLPGKVTVSIPNRAPYVIPMGGAQGAAPSMVRFARLFLSVTQTITLFMNAAGGAGAQYIGWLLLNPFYE